MSILIRLGGESDTDWVIRLMEAGARDRHFGPTVAKQATEMMNSIVCNGFLNIIKLRNGDQSYKKLKTEFWVAEINGNPASFLITLVDHKNENIELHMAGTSKEYRRKGGFASLINHAKSKKPDGYTLFARCYRKSSWAIAALQKNGFHTIEDGDPVELCL